MFLTGWEDGSFPHLRALHDPVELAEERRLAYVGITRARERLYLSRALVRSAWGQPMNNPPSRFFDDIPEELLDWRRMAPSRSNRSDFGRVIGGGSAQADIAENGMRGTRFGGWREERRRTPMRSPGANSVPIVLDVGDRVNHDKYGLGTVVATSGSGPHSTATIDFGGGSTVKLMLIGGVPLQKL